MSAFASHLPLRRGRRITGRTCTCATAVSESKLSAADSSEVCASPSRRSALLALCGAAGAALFPRAIGAVVSPTEEVASDLHGYSFRVPSNGWTRSSASLSGFRNLTAYTRDGDMSGATNVSMVETAIPGDFMKLTSFGPLETVLKILVPDGQGGVSGDVISARQDSSKNAYVVEYRLKPSADAPVRHLVTVFSLQPGRYLLTLTAQTTEDKWEKEEKVLKDVAESFKLRLMD